MTFKFEKILCRLMFCIKHAYNIVAHYLICFWLNAIWVWVLNSHYENESLRIRAAQCGDFVIRNSALLGSLCHGIVCTLLESWVSGIFHEITPCSNWKSDGKSYAFQKIASEDFQDFQTFSMLQHVTVLSHCLPWHTALVGPWLSKLIISGFPEKIRFCTLGLFFKIKPSKLKLKLST